MGSSHSKPLYMTSGISGATGGAIGAIAVCVCIFSLPVSVATVGIGAVAGGIAGVSLEHIWPSESNTEAIIKGVTVGAIAGGTAYYSAVKLCPDIVLSDTQVKVIKERAYDIVKNGDVKPSKSIYCDKSKSFIDQYEIKDVKTGYKVKVENIRPDSNNKVAGLLVSSQKLFIWNKGDSTYLQRDPTTGVFQRKNALKIEHRKHLVKSVPKWVAQTTDASHEFIVVKQGKKVLFRTELTNMKGSKGLLGKCRVSIKSKSKAGIKLDEYFLDPNEWSNGDKLKKFIKQFRKQYKGQIYNPGRLNCQTYCRDLRHELTGESKCNIPMTNQKLIDAAKLVVPVTLTSIAGGVCVGVAGDESKKQQKNMYM